ncbi:TetR/AcrR family transcriptional regulator [Spirochaeta cellobiosiphila]|uniref:TetR/AcrR family transcriptional regulator n=1 Tax=Spirochaeta cellobiosiphila TaxID=504483 RepID=UPI0003FC2FE9|nr:TetR/AcrR family transcriptional regulator [Spirochaeta cellobiosiphila]
MSRHPDQNKKRKILEASLEAFGELGYKKTTIKHIATKAEIAPGSIYTYFNDKTTLFVATIDDVWNRYIERTINISNEDWDFETKFMESIDFGLELLYKAHYLLGSMLSTAERRAMLTFHLKQTINAIQPLFLAGQAEGIFVISDDPELRSFQLETYICGILFELSVVEKKEVKQKIDFIRKGIYKHFFMKS